MVMNGFDTNFDRSNEVYAVNTVAFAYMDEPVQVKRGELVRIYLVNALEFDLAQLVPHPRQLLRLLPDRHAARAARLHRHRDPGPGRARHPRAALPVHGQVHVPRPRLRVRRARLDGLLRGARTDGGRHRRPPPPGLAHRPDPGRRARRGDRPVRGARRARASIASACRRRSWPSSAPCCARARSSCTCATTAPTRCRSSRRSSTTASPRSPRPRRRSAGSAAPRSRSSYPWIEGEAYEVLLLTATGAHDRPRDRGGGRDARRRPRLLRPDGPDRPLRRRDPGGDRDALAALAAHASTRAGSASCSPSPSACSASSAIEALLEGTRARRRGPGGARRRARWSGSARSAPTWRWPAWTPGCAVARGRSRGHGRRARRGAPPRRARRLPGRARHRPPQPRRGPRDRLRLRDRLARAGRRAGRRLRPAQHHRGARDRRAGGRARARRGCARWSCSACSPARPPCWAPGSAPPPSTRASPR